AVTEFQHAVERFAASSLPAAQTGPVPSLAGGGLITGSGLLFGHQDEIVMGLDELRAKLKEGVLEGGIFGKASERLVASLSCMSTEDIAKLSGITAGNPAPAPASAPENFTLHVNLGGVHFERTDDLEDPDVFDKKILKKLDNAITTGIRGYRE